MDALSPALVAQLSISICNVYHFKDLEDILFLFYTSVSVYIMCVKHALGADIVLHDWQRFSNIFPQKKLSSMIFQSVTSSA